MTRNALMITAAIAALAINAPVHAQGEGEEEAVEFIRIIGSRAPGRTAMDTPVPVDVFTREDLERTGVRETAALLQRIAPSFNESTSTISDGTDILRPAALRGLGPDQTLVLINGKRRHASALVHVNGSVGRGTAGVDLNAIPVSAISRIEVLRDGAAAQYGSDAIAGVINIVLKGSGDPNRLSASIGQMSEGDGEMLQLSGSHAFEFANGGFLAITAELRNRGATNRAGLDPRQQYASLPGGGDDPREAGFNRLNHRYGDAESENQFLFFNAEMPLGDMSRVYVFGGISRREGESGGFYRRSLDARNIPSVYPDGFLPLINTDVEDDGLTVGIAGTMGLWDVDASYTYGANSFNFFISNSVNVSLGPSSPTEADAGTLETDQHVFNLDANRLGQFGDIPVNIALGLEHRQDGYQIIAGDFASWANGPDDDPATAFPNQYGGVAAPGIQVFPGFRPSNEVDAERSSWAAYVDLEMDLSDRFRVGTAARFEDYDDFGSTLTGKLTARYEVSDALALRAAASTGFRAPSLSQANLNNTSTQFVLVGASIEPREVGTVRNDSAVARALGVEPLQEETSVNLSAGFVYADGEGWTISADVYSIKIEDRIVLSGRFSRANPAIDALLASFPEVNAVQFFTNAIDTETTGLDIVAQRDFELDNGDVLGLSAAANFTDTSLDGPVRTPAALAGEGETLYDRVQQVWLEEGQPGTSATLAVDYRRGGLSAVLSNRYFGEVSSTESATDTSRDQTFDGKWLTDLEVEYAFDNGVALALGGNNVFDIYPDEQLAANSFNGIFPYPRRTAPFGFNGAFWYARASFTY